MIIVTSLSPGHSNKENQHNAVKSWQEYGECYSMNNAHEISQLEQLYSGIKFIKTDRTIRQLIGKALVSINAMIDYANERGEDLLLINSDIVLTGLPEFKQDGITIFSRYDYTDNINDNKKFEAGFDMFYIPNNFLSIFPPSIYAMGACFWDYWIPYRAMLNNFPVYWHEDKYALHKIHPIQYNHVEWEYIGQFFKWEFKLNSQWSIPQVATNILRIINSKIIKV